jgi:hypothetical protein
MAHFAELDENNVVKRVIVVGNADTSDAHGVEKEHIGAAFCERLLGGTWKQTSYNGNMRKRYAGIGFVYNAALDAFVPPKPYPLGRWIIRQPIGKHQLQSQMMGKHILGTSQLFLGMRFLFQLDLF